MNQQIIDQYQRETKDYHFKKQFNCIKTEIKTIIKQDLVKNS